jgi:hypothetical protein
MARSVAKQSLADEPIPHKAYLYVLRALLAVRWAEQCRGPVPVVFDRLVAATVDANDLRAAIDGLVARKKAGKERDEGPRLPVLHDFVDAELDRQADAQFPESGPRPDTEPLNDLFRTVLARTAGSQRT